MDASLIIGVFVPALLTAFAGLWGWWLVRRGMRGRRAGQHPVCAACEFNLTGLPEDQARCPECGADLAARRAVAQGHRQRRPTMVFAGYALLALAVLGGALVARGAREVDWQRVKPVAWLAREARSGDAAAWAELSRRVRAGAIRGERVQPIIADALALQKDLTRTWLPAVGDFVEDARAAEMVTDKDWQTYARQAPQLSLRWRAKVRRGDDLPGEVTFGKARAGNKGTLSIRTEKPIDTSDPLAIRPRQDRSGGYSQQSLSGMGGGGSTGVHLQLDRKNTEVARLGRRTTTIRWTAEVRDDWDSGTPVIEWTQDLSADWELVERDARTIEMVPDDSPELRTQIEQALTITELAVSPRHFDGPGHYLTLKLKIGALPVPVSFQVFLRAGEEEHKLASISTAGATSYHTGGHIPASATFDAQRVDVVFRPSPEAAYGTVDITRMWNGEVVIPDVEVKWPTTQPATRP